MSGRTSARLAQLSERERFLLGVMTLVALPLAVFFLGVQPLLDARDTAARQAQEAAALRDWVAAQVRVFPEDAQAQAAQTSGAIGITGIEDGLVAWGVRDAVSQLANRDNGVDIAFDAVPFDLLGQWLVSQTPDWGYDIRAFRVEMVSLGLVNARFELEPAR